MITFDRLRYFVEVATLEHVGNAAKLLAVSPSVVSAAIRELEEEFSCELFIREKQRIRLTDRGEILLEKARSILTDAERLYSEVNSGEVKLKGHYRIGASHFLMQEYLVPAFIEIQKDHPGLTVEFVAVDTGVAISRLMQNELDAAFVFRSSNYHELDETVLYRGEFQITVKKAHPLMRVTGKKLVECLNEIPAITFRTSNGPNFWENHPAFKAVEIKPKHTYFYEDTQTALQLLSSTNGWAFLPDKIVSKYKNLQKIRTPQPLHAPVNISFIRRKNSASNPFLETLKEVLAKRMA